MTAGSVTAMIRPALVLFTLTALAACGGSDRATAPDDTFGHRFEDGSDTRETLALAPRDTTQEYFSYPAVVDTLHVRPAPLGRMTDDGLPVEVLVKGALPDGCSELSGVEQERAGNLVTVMLTMRRPKGAFCTQVVRPYRFYLPLDGRYRPGAYTLKLNDRTRPFEITTRESES
ncbi:MAG: hypothetical protein AAGF99_10240 [Bacteroidota bacterium]